MKVPLFLSSFVEGDAPKRLFQGLAVGVIGTLIIGFNWGGWNVAGTVAEKVETASRTSMVTALAPICADKFERAAKADNDLVVKLAAVDSWMRDDHLMRAGWATFPGGGADPDRGVASACADLLNTALKLK